MDNHHAFWNRNSLRRWLAAAALGLLWVTGVHAKVAEYDAFNAFMAQATGGNKYTVGFGTGGTPLVTSGVPGPSQVGNMNFSHSAGGWPSASGTSQVPLPSGNLPVKMSKPVSPLAAGKAVAKFASKVAGPLVVGMAVYDLLKDLNIIGTNDPATGENTFAKQTTGWVFTTHCYTSTVLGPSPGDDLALACQAELRRTLDSTATCWWVYQSGRVDAGAVHCKRPKFGVVDEAYSSTPQGTVTTNTPMTEDAVAAAIAAQSGWPSTSSIDAALADVAKYPGPIDLGPLFDTNINDFQMQPQVAKVDGPKRTTTGTDGSSKTSQLSCDWVIPMYSTLQYKCWETTTIAQPEYQQVTTTNPDGTTTTKSVPVTATQTVIMPDGSQVTQTVPKTNTTTTTTTSDADAPKEGCDALSKSLDCAELDTPEGKVPKSTFNLTYAAESLGLGAGSCPADKTITTHDGKTIKAFDYADACARVTTYVRPLVLVLAAFVAMLILMPGGAAVRGGEA